METATRTASRRGRGAAMFIGGGLLLTLLQGCAAVRDTAQFAHEAFDPGVPGPQPISVEAAAQLSDEQISRRLEILTRSLEDNRTHAAWWQYGFLTVSAGGMIAGATTAAFEEDADSQVFDILNASLGLIGTGYLLGAPLPGRCGAAPIFAMPFDTHAQRAAQLAAAEEILYDAAGRARQRTGWLLHVGNVVLNGAAASVLLAREAYDKAALLFFLNSSVGAAQILLTPWGPLTAWEDYRRFVDTGAAQPTAAEPTIGIGPLPGAHGLAVNVAF